MYIQIHIGYIEREREKEYTVRCEKVSQKSNLCICSGALWLVANAIRYFCKVCGGWPRAFTNL